jgi:hypothetical protein
VSANDLTEQDMETIGVRRAGCDCCLIVDGAGLHEVIRRHKAEALREAADVMSSRLEEFAGRGSHTRARWATQWLRDYADRIANGASE